MRVLIVSQDSTERKLIRSYLERLPFKEYDKAYEIEIYEEESGEKAFERITSGQETRFFYDLLISAQKMNGMTGLQLVKKLNKKKIAPMMPTAVFSDNLTIDLKKEKTESGATVFFELPKIYEEFKNIMAKIAAILIYREESARKEKIEKLMSKRKTSDFMAAIENIYMSSASNIGKYKIYAPWLPQPYISLSRIYMGANKYAEAIPYLKTVIKINFHDRSAYHNLLMCYKKTGKSFLELEELKKMLIDFPDSSEVLLKIGDAYLRKGDYENAVKYCKKAIENHKLADSNHLKAKTHVSLGKAYVMEGDDKNDPAKYKDAEEEFNSAVSIDPILLAAYQNLIVIYSKQGKHEDARKTLAEATKIMPDDAEGWLSLFEIYIIDGDISKAKISLEKAFNYDPENQIILMTAGEIYMRQSMYDEAVEIFKMALDVNQSDIRFHNYLGLCYRRLKQIGPAIKNYNKALTIDPEDPDIHYNIGQAYKQNDLLPLAREAFQKALQLKPDFPEATKALETLEKS